MTPDELDALDDVEIPQMALKALDDAQRRAIASGRTVLIIEDGMLIQIQGDSRTVLKQVPPRREVSVRIKRASS